MRSLLALVLLFFPLVKCSQPLEFQARNGIAAASGFIGQEVVANKDVCANMPEESRCQMIKKAAQSINITVDALEAYCAGPSFNAGTAPCQPPTSSGLKSLLASKLTSSLSDLDRDVTDVKKLGGK